MGLDLTAVNKEYGFKKVWYDSRTDEKVEKTDDVTEKKGFYCDYEDIETNERFSDASIGYFGFMSFRTALAEKYGLKDYYRWVTNFGTYFFREQDYGLIMSIEDAEDGDEKHPKFLPYIEKMKRLKNEEYFDLLPLLLHSDCDGEMPLQDVKRIYPKVKEFLQEYIDGNIKKFGYTGRDYEWFEKDFLIVLEEVIKNKGKLLFY